MRRCGHRPRHLINTFAKIAQGHHDLGQVNGQGISNRLAHGQAFQQGQVRGVFLDQIGKAAKDRHPRARGHVPPAPVIPGGLGAGHGQINVLSRPTRHIGHERAIGWV